DADLGTGTDGRPAHRARGDLERGEQIVRDHDPGSEKDVILQLGELSDVAVAMDLCSVSDDAPVVHNGVAPDGDVVPQPVLLPDHHVMPGLEPSSDARSRVEDGAPADPRSLPEHEPRV